eukprot:3658560-Pleurochrysis_carterae.AAC.3
MAAFVTIHEPKFRRSTHSSINLGRFGCSKSACTSAKRHPSTTLAHALTGTVDLGAVDFPRIVRSGAMPVLPLGRLSSYDPPRTRRDAAQSRAGALKADFRQESCHQLGRLPG